MARIKGRPKKEELCELPRLEQLRSLVFGEIAPWTIDHEHEVYELACQSAKKPWRQTELEKLIVPQIIRAHRSNSGDYYRGLAAVVDACQPSDERMAVIALAFLAHESKGLSAPSWAWLRQLLARENLACTNKQLKRLCGYLHARPTAGRPGRKKGTINHRNWGIFSTSHGA